jgi:hypothetical protein
MKAFKEPDCKIRLFLFNPELEKYSTGTETKKYSQKTKKIAIFCGISGYYPVN